MTPNSAALCRRSQTSLYYFNRAASEFTVSQQHIEKPDVLVCLSFGMLRLGCPPTQSAPPSLSPKMLATRVAGIEVTISRRSHQQNFNLDSMFFAKESLCTCTKGQKNKALHACNAFDRSIFFGLSPKILHVHSNERFFSPLCSCDRRLWSRRASPLVELCEVPPLLRLCRRMRSLLRLCAVACESANDVLC